MRVAVTGSSGYLGRLFVERLIAEGIVGADLLGIDLAPSALPASRMRWLGRDVRDPRLAADLAGCDAVVHLAFIVEAMRDRQLMYDVNLGGTRNVLHACERAGVKTLVVTSSIAAYGAQGDRVITETSPLRGDRRSYYAHTKRLVEEELDLFEARNPRVRVARLRPAVVLGPSCDTWALEVLLASRLDTRRGLHLPVIHEQDLVDAMWLAFAGPARGPLLLTLREPLGAADLARIAGHRRIVVPERLLYAAAGIGFALGQTRMSRDWMVLALSSTYRTDPSATERALGWHPRFTAEQAAGAALERARRVGAGRRRGPRVDRIEGTRYPEAVA